VLPRGGRCCLRFGSCRQRTAPRSKAGFADAGMTGKEAENIAGMAVCGVNSTLPCVLVRTRLAGGRHARPAGNGGCSG
jgi:hypothetical protein